MQTFKLNNGVEIPVLGFGVFQIPAKQTAQAVVDAVKAGYRHIDTAQAYMNETEVGQGIRNSGVPREQLFVTSKVWVENYGYEAAKASLDRSLARLDCGYIDLMLLHQPFNDVYGAWRALEEYQASGRIRAIGLSNFTADRVLDVGLFNKVMPAVDQIEINPFHQQTEQVQGLLAEGVVPEAWGPFAEGKFGIFENPVLTAIGQKYGKSVAQVVTRWLIERGIVVLAKSTKPERMAQNLNVFDFQLDDDDKAQIATLDVGKSQIISHTDLAMVRKFKEWVFNV